MHDIRMIRETPNAFDAALSRRGLAPVSPAILALDIERRAAIKQTEDAQAAANAAAKHAAKAGKPVGRTPDSCACRAGSPRCWGEPKATR